MLAEIITIGDEILIGQTIDTNSAWLADQLHRIGVRLREIRTVADEREAIRQAVDEAMAVAELTIVTGGLGPTNDDITKQTLAEYFDSPMVRHAETLERIEGFFASRGLKMLDMNLTQADVPERAKILVNKRGTAPGMWFERDGRVVLSIPGVPHEMKGLMLDQGLSLITAMFDPPPIIHKTVLTQGIGESYLADKLTDWETALRNDGIFLAYLPSPGRVRLRLTSYPEKGQDDAVGAKMERYIDELMRRVPKNVYGRDTQSLAGVVEDLLRRGNLTLATAESCTGGYVAHLITGEPGASDIYVGGSVTYSDRAKINQLGVRRETLNAHGAVSEEVVREMAEGVRKTFGADFGIATTGIAGPDGGSTDKPVGTVWTAVASAKSTETKLLRLGTDRGRNIEIASLTVLNSLRNTILSLGLVE